MIRLKKRTAGQRRFLVETVAEFRNWALAEAAALDSVRLAPNHPQEAREWAELAVQVSELVPGDETRRRRLQGWTRHFLANALRACNDLPAAEKARARGRKLWEAGAPGDPGLLAEAWLPWIDANLRKDQRRLPEALKRIDEALALDQGELRGEILLSKSNILRRLDDPAGSTAVLLEAEPLIDARREPLRPGAGRGGRAPPPRRMAARQTVGRAARPHPLPVASGAGPRGARPGRGGAGRLAPGAAHLL
jgi:tetratricopeptide (TPR) repeat protein